MEFKINGNHYVKCTLLSLLGRQITKEKSCVCGGPTKRVDVTAAHLVRRVEN